MEKFSRKKICVALVSAFSVLALNFSPASANGDEFTAAPGGKIDRKIAKKTVFKMAPAFSMPIMPEKEISNDVEIMGAAEATEEQMASYIKKRNPEPKLNCSVEAIVRYYYIEAGREGIRPDIALSQAIKETGVFGYGGDVSPTQNNFCGLGATGNHEPGAKFITPQLGVRAHIQHLLAYASKQEPSMPVIDPRYELIVKFHPEIHGKIGKWTGLNGVWAVPGTMYGEDILKIWRQAIAPDGSDASLDAAMRIVENSPDDVDAHIYRAAVYMAREEFFAAKSDLDFAIQRKPSAELYYDRALINTKRRANDAIKDYTRAVELDPRLTEAYYNRGLLLAAADRHKEAIADFNKALELEPQLAAAQNNLAVIALGKRKYDDGWEALFKAGQINSANATVLANQKALLACVKQPRSKRRAK